MGNNPPASASWGKCDDDLKRESILSPYSYKTAKEHYEALLAAAKAKGGPTVYTKATVPIWTATFSGTRKPITAPNGSGESAGRPLCSPCSPGISKAHGAVDLSRSGNQRSAMERVFLLSRRIHPLVGAAFAGGKLPAHEEHLERSVHLRQLRTTFCAKVMVGKEQHLQKVLQWYGETIGFWDGTKLVIWTANIQGCTLTHSMFEISDKLEVETYKPAYDAKGKFVGLDHEAIFYNPEAFAASVRAS